MNRERMMEVIMNASVNRRLSCEKAHDLSRELAVPLKQIGALCDELKIKITACQLGCF